MPEPSEDVGEQLSELSRNAVQSLPEGALAEKLRVSAREGRPLRIKLGIDPTSPDIHLGHAVVLRKLADFQRAGHMVVLIVGDFTARVGDPSGRSQLRPMLSAEEIEANARTYQEQAFKILDSERIEVRHNSEWLDMGMTGMLELARQATAGQLLEREDFAKRRAEGRPISMLELIYPLLVAYDSVAVRADLELGGTDQTFNLLFGRDIQRAYGQPEQAVMTMPLIVGLDGSAKMSKSLGNHIGVTDLPEEMYGKTMSIPDAAMAEFFPLLLGREAPGGDPLQAKRELARGIVGWLHSPGAAERAEAHFDRVVREGRPPEELQEASFTAAEGPVHLPGLIAEAFGMSRSEARRLIDQGAVALDEKTLGRGDYDLPGEDLEGRVLRAGKRRFKRLRAA